jgi:hypothetical protein
LKKRKKEKENSKVGTTWKHVGKLKPKTIG